MNATAMFKNFFSVGLLALAMASSSLAYEMRTWTATNGKQVEAAYVKYEFPNVSLQRRDGQIINVHRDNLCDEDWLYVSQYDLDILTFWIKLGEVPVRHVTAKNDVSNLSFRHVVFNPMNVQGDKMRNAMKQVLSASTPKMMSFYVADNGMVLADYNSEWKTLFPLPNDPDEFFHPPFPKNEWDRGLEASYFVRLKNGERYTVSRWYSFWSNNPTAAHTEVIHLLAINGSGVRSEYGREIKDSVSEQFAINEKFKTDVQLFVLDTKAGEEISKLTLEAMNVSSKLARNARYSRLKAILDKRQSGVPTETRTPTGKKKLGSGSGFFITPDGYFLTNYHVVHGGSSIVLVTEKGNVSAKVVRIDPAVDLALLKVDSTSFQSIPFLAANEAALGTDIFTIGFPIPDLQGFSPKMTKGVISSMRGLHDDEKEYQIDAAVQPGNSGGPVVNNNGEVVGVVVARLRDEYVAETKGFLPQNVNYAIKKKHVLDFLSQVPNCLRGIKSSNLPASGSSASPAVVDSVLKSCAMVIVYE